MRVDISAAQMSCVDYLDLPKASTYDSFECRAVSELVHKGRHEHKLCIRAHAHRDRMVGCEVGTQAAGAWDEEVPCAVAEYSRHTLSTPVNDKKGMGETRHVCMW